MNHGGKTDSQPSSRTTTYTSTAIRPAMLNAARIAYIIGLMYFPFIRNVNPVTTPPSTVSAPMMVAVDAGDNPSPPSFMTTIRREFVIRAPEFYGSGG